MNVEIASQLESPLVTSLQSSLVSKPFNYSLKTNYPILSKLNVSVSPDTTPSGSAHGRQITFKVPRYGLLSGMVIKMDIATSATKTATLTRLNTLGTRIFSNVSLRSHSRVIQDNSSYDILSRMNEAPTEQFNAYENLTTGSPAVNNNVTSSIVYTPLFFFFGERSEAYLDASFCEPLEVVCTVNTQAGIWGDSELLSTISFNSLSLECFYIQLENGVQQSLTAAQFPPSKNLTLLANDCYVESPTSVVYASGTTLSMSQSLKCKNVAYSTYVYAHNKTTNALLAINSATLIANGQTVVSTDRRTQIFDNSKLGFIHNVPGSSSGSNSYSIYYGLDVSKTYLSGVQAFASLNEPILSVVIDTSSGVSANDVIELLIIHEYCTLLSISSDSGTVSRSLTN